MDNVRAQIEELRKAQAAAAIAERDLLESFSAGLNKDCAIPSTMEIMEVRTKREHAWDLVNKLKASSSTW